MPRFNAVIVSRIITAAHSKVVPHDLPPDTADDPRLRSNRSLLDADGGHTVPLLQGRVDSTGVPNLMLIGGGTPSGTDGGR